MHTYTCSVNIAVWIGCNEGNEEIKANATTVRKQALAKETHDKNENVIHVTKTVRQR